MKKAKSSTRRPARKRRKAPKTVEEYLAAVPEPARSTLNKIRAAIRSTVPADATEAISYGIPTFKYGGSLVWFAAFANHCSLFPGASAIHAFKDELKDYQVSKGTIRFPVDKPLPDALVKKIGQGADGRKSLITRRFEWSLLHSVGVSFGRTRVSAPRFQNREMLKYGLTVRGDSHG